jgi:hypothetical protein
MIGIDVLAEQGQLANTLIHETTRFVDETRDGARDLRTARIGHDAERTELVATLLHCEKRGRLTPHGGRPFAWRQMLELVVFWKLGLDEPFLASPDARDELRQAMIAL